MYHQRLSDQAIINGFRRGDAGMYELMAYEDMDFTKAEIMEQKRSTPEFLPSKRTTSERITSLEPNEIFVFGSNLKGMQGGVETIRPYVDEFIQFAKQHPELTFLVTRIGCGIAGFTDDEISPLFAEAHGVENIVLPPNW